MRLASVLFAFSFLLSSIAFAQESIGLRLSDYAGINGNLLNPTFSAKMPYSWDVNLVEAGFNFNNNYAYFRMQVFLL